MDISLVKKDEYYDWDISTGNLSLNDDLYSAVMCSLLSDGLSDETHTNIPYNKRRGWWGSYQLDGYFGNQWWTCLSEAVDTETLQTDLTNYARQSLQHLIDNNVVKSIVCNVTLIGHLRASILITLTKPDNNKSVYSIFWNNI